MAHAAGRAPVLLLCAHGTRSQAGTEVVADLVRRVASALPKVDVRLAFVDVQHPSVTEALSQLPAEHPVVLVPLLLSWGHHVEADVRAVATGRQAAVATAPLGPDPRLAQVLARRLGDAGVPDGVPVVLAAAGSTQLRATADARLTRDQLAVLRGAPVTLGFAAAQHPSVEEAVRSLRAGGQTEVAVAAYLLAPGHFLDALRSCAADIVTAPIGTAPEIVAIIRQRYVEGLGLLGLAGAGRA
ncbi:MAG: sirohydrochlorin chelatase [Dermatophilaceae bacterium]